MIHDFMVTQRYLMLPVLPVTGSMERAQRGEPAYLWEPHMGSHVAVVPRNGNASQVRWFRGEPCYVFHVMNAWESADGSKLYADVMQYDQAPLFNTDPDAKVYGRLCRWTFDLAGNTDTFTSTQLDDLSGEFPRIDDRFATLPYRHGYFASHQTDTGPAIAYNTLVHLDLETGRRVQHQLPAGDYVSEPVFVPRRPDSAEGDGWLLATAYRGAESRSDLLVYEAGALADGPVATVQLSHRVPFGFHGNWRDARG
jgi:carotenoid cleavage dioxygenase